MSRRTLPGQRLRWQLSEQAPVILREEDAFIGNSLWSSASFQNMVKRHQMMIAKYPHAKIGKGRTYEGIENLRPESVEAVEHFMSWQSDK